MAKGVESCSYDYEYWDSKPLKRRGSNLYPSKYSGSQLDPLQHKVLTHWEEMERYRALSVYEYHKCEYKRRIHEKETYQRHCYSTSKKTASITKRSLEKYSSVLQPKQSSSSTKRNPSKEYHGKRINESMESRIDSTPCSSKMVDSLMEEMTPILQKYFEQVQAHFEQAKHIPTNDPKGDVHELVGNVDEIPQAPTGSSEEEKDLSIIVHDEGIHEQSSGSNTCAFVVINTSYFTQVEKGHYQCAIPRSFVQFMSFHGLYLFGVSSMINHFVQALEFKTGQVCEESTQAAIQVHKPAFGTTFATLIHYTGLHNVDFLGVEWSRVNCFDIYQGVYSRAHGEECHTHPTVDMQGYHFKDVRELKHIYFCDIPFLPKIVWILQLSERHLAWIIYLQVTTICNCS